MIRMILKVKLIFIRQSRKQRQCIYNPKIELFSRSRVAKYVSSLSNETEKEETSFKDKDKIHVDQYLRHSK